MASPVSNILKHGYFPKELPPPFNSLTFGAFANTPGAAVLDLDLSKKGVNKNFVSRPAIHNLARAGTLRRKLTIPNPVNQYQVAKAIADGWKTIKAICSSSPFSLTTPVYRKHTTRAITAKHYFDALPIARARSRTGSKYLLTTDLSQFYPSIYTHSIPWAIHGKALSKTKPTDYSMLGNVIDLAIRNGQDKQTMGIPIGPDTSLAIAEVILSSVDAKLSGPILSRGFRYIDDIGCGFRTIAEAEGTLADLQKLIGDLQLELNPKKTKIVELPVELEAAWVPHLRLFNLRASSASVQQTDLLSYFGRAFELAADNREEAILRYAVQRLRSVNILKKNWPLYESILLQCLLVEPGTASAVIGEFYRYHLRMPLNLELIGDSLRQLIESHAPMHHGSEVVWAVWGAICLNCKLDSQIMEKALSMSDPCVSLCVLHANSMGLVNGTIDFSSQNALMSEGELSEAQWLLVYEANIKGWLPNLRKKDFVAANKYFGPLKGFGVSFYDLSAKPFVTVMEEGSGEYQKPEVKSAIDLFDDLSVEFSG